KWTKPLNRNQVFSFVLQKKFQTDHICILPGESKNRKVIQSGLREENTGESPPSAGRELETARVQYRSCHLPPSSAASALLPHPLI
ncbi:mCG144779, partial [Mus musculus]